MLMEKNKRVGKENNHRKEIVKYKSSRAKFILLILSFLLLVSLLSIISAYVRSVPAYTIGGRNAAYTGGQLYPTLDRNLCQASQDFILQIDPTGCTPPIVRSDLLEEQDVVVFCPIIATQLNPLIKVNDIRNMIITSHPLPQGVLTVGYQPAQAALGNRNPNSENPILGNVGYATIVLRRQGNESAMPNFVQGNLTARLTYSVDNAFGTGRSLYYLPELSDQDWNRDYTAYSFWGGRGYLKLEGADDNGATIGVYSDRDISGNARAGEKTKIATLNLDDENKVKQLYLPGLGFCMGGINVELKDLENPDIAARIRVDSELLEVRKGEKFLENACEVKKIEKRGLNQRVEISCREDQRGTSFRGGSFELRINPKIKIAIGNEGEREYNVGDRLYNDTTNSVYLGFIGNKGNSNSAENLYIRVISIPLDKGGSETKLSETELSHIATYDRRVSSLEIRGGAGASAEAQQALVRAAASIGELFRRFQSGKNIQRVGFDSEEAVFGKNIRIIGYSGTYDFDISQASQEIQDNYQKAMSDYETIKENYASERYPSNDPKTLGEQALEGAILLANDLEQRRTVLELCQEFSENYGSAQPEICINNYLLSNIDISGQSVVINGQTHLLAFEGAKDPGFEDFGLELNVRYANGEVNTFNFSRDEIVYINDEIIYSYDPSSLRSPVYYRYYGNRWQWSHDKDNWMDTNTVIGRGGSFNAKSPSDEQQEVIRYLEETHPNFDVGRRYLLDLEAEEELNDEYIQLVNLEPTSATLKTNLKKTRAIASNILNQKLEIGKEETFDSRYSFSIKKINLNRVAKVSLDPQLDYVRANATFNFKIGIEKRSIQLSPEKTKEKITSLNNTIQKWEKISNNLGKVVTAGKAACLLTGGYLTAKNFFSNIAAKGNARQIVMRGEGGWYDQCKREVDNPIVNPPYRNIEACLLANSDKIDASVNEYNSGIEEQNQDIQQLTQGITRTTILGERITNTDALAMRLLNPNINPEFGTEISTNVNSVLGNQIRVGNQDIPLSDIINRIDENTTTYNQARILQLNSRLLNSEDETVSAVAEIQVKKILGEIYGNSNNRVAALNFEQQSQNDVSNPQADYYTGTNQIEGTYRGSTAQAGNRFGIQERAPVQLIVFNNQKWTLELEAISTSTYIIKNIYNEAGTKLAATDSDFLAITRFFSAFKLRDANSYQNRYQNYQIRYYETEPYKGFPAIVPFDIQNGWYAAVRSNLPVLGGLRAYDDSGRVSSFYVCNVGSNGREDNMGVDDDCQSFVPNQGAAPVFSGMEPREALQLMNDAVSAIEQASRAYNSGIRQVTITIRGRSQRIPVGEPAANIPDIQCEDFMSPTDCNLMFNVCDPVICPSSRCDLGGAYPVKDVVQSGIAGSIFLCLPNYPEVKVPICVTGVHAGIEAYTSVLKSYRQCLQQSVDTGQVVGICDEINSVYQCQFLWGQLTPVIKYGIPQILGRATGGSGRGGGEYLGVADAWTTAQNSVNYFTQYYADDSVRAFRQRSTQNVGGEICRLYTSAVFPSGGNFFDNFVEPDSPTQFYGRFEEIPYTTTTNPPISQYKVFYHIYAGKDYPANFQVYLRGAGSSFYQDTDFRKLVPRGSGFIPSGESKTDTVDFTAPSGYKQLCIVVNGQEECGFKEVTTDFGINFLAEQYVSQEASRTDINSEAECVSGSPGVFNLLNPTTQAGLLSPNIQEVAVSELNPAIYNRGIIRVCATNNPGQGTDVNAGGEDTRWQPAGTCGQANLKCWLDTDSVKDVIRNSNIENQTLGEVESNYIQGLQNDGQYMADFGSFTEELKDLDEPSLISTISNNINKILYNNQRAYLYLWRGTAYGVLAAQAYSGIRRAHAISSATTGVEAGTTEEETPSGGEEPVIQGLPAAGTQALGVSYPVFEFQDGTARDNLRYTFSTDKWYWCSDNCAERRNWYEPNLAQLAGTQVGEESTLRQLIPSLSNKNKQFILNLVDKTYLQGLQLLMHRTAQNQEGGILPCWAGGCALLSTENVEFSHESIFNVKIEGKSVLGTDFEFVASQNKWRWSPDKENWMFTPITKINRGVFDGQTPSLKISNLIRNLGDVTDRKNFEEGAEIIFSIDTQSPATPSGTTTPTTTSSTCTNLIDCQKVLGARIIQLASQKKQARNIADSSVLRDTGSKSFECLVLQIAIQESGILQCGEYESGVISDFQRDGNPSYCEGNRAEILHNPVKEDSYGIMQINLDAHENALTQRGMDIAKFNDNVNYGVDLLISGYNITSKQFTCRPGKSYSGWERAIRNYNGWGCNGNSNYVEEVKNNTDEVVALFPECA